MSRSFISDSLKDLFDLQPSTNIRIILQDNKVVVRSDREALSQDWKNIGKDISKAMELIND